MAASGILTDWKMTSVWAVMNGGKEEWESQLNVYAHLLRRHGHGVGRLRVVAILRDWRTGESKRTKNYPPLPIVTREIPLWEPAKALAFIEERVRLHAEAKGALADCSDEERWKRGGKYLRCESYCAAAKFCDQWKETQSGKRAA